MPLFNSDSRTKNAVKTSTINIIYQIINIVLQFAYRTIFIQVLAVQYLGLNGLFSDILNLLSLAELGIGGTIAYRLYKPIKENNAEDAAKLMYFFKNVYRGIALVVTVIGLAIMPALPYIIKNSSELPSDINLYALYAVFLLQSVSGYFFAYKQTLLNADQRNYVLTLFNVVSAFVKFGGQIAILLVLKSYMFTLVFSVAWTILMNFLISIYVTKKYKEVFKLKGKLTKLEKKSIIKDTAAMMMHKVGSVILYSTDSIVIASMIGLETNGVLSNYLLIIGVIKILFSQLFAGAGAGLGNLCASGDPKDVKRVFNNLQFATMWASGFAAIGLICLLNPFIKVWLNKDLYLLDVTYVITIVISTYIVLTRNACITLTYSGGLFVKDKLRPIIEALLNLGISILLANYIGLYGIYLGTIISCLIAPFWREPHIIYKYIFKEKEREYWFKYITFFAVTVMAGAITYFSVNFIPDGIGYFVLKFLIVCILPNLLFALAFFKNDSFKYYSGVLKGLFKRFRKVKDENKEDGSEVKEEIE